MATNELCSTFVTGDCNKEIRALCGKFEVELVLYDPYMMFDISDDCEVDNGSGIWYAETAGNNISVSANDTETGEDVLYRMKIRSDNPIEYIRFISDTYKKINIISGDDLISANKMCYNLKTLKSFTLTGFNQIVDFTSMFENCLALNTVNNFFIIPEDMNGGITNVMPRMFRHCEYIKYMPNLDFSLSTDMDYIFSHTYRLEYIQDIVVNQNFTADGMYTAASALKTQPIINTENITTSKDMFRGCANIVSFSDISLTNSLDTSGLFHGCSRVKTIYNLNIGDSSVDRMFYKCYELKCIDQIDTENSSYLPAEDMFALSLKLLVPSPTYKEEIETTGLDFNNLSSCPPIEVDKDFIVNIPYENERDVSFIADADLVVDWGNSTYCGTDSTKVVTDGSTDGEYTPDGCSIVPGSKYSIIEGSETYAYKAGEIIKYDKEYDLSSNPREPIKIYAIDKVTTFKILPNNSVKKINVLKAESLTSLDEFAQENKLLGIVQFPSDYNMATSANYAFYGCTNMYENNLNSENVLSADYMFTQCSKFVIDDFEFKCGPTISLENTFKECDPIYMYMPETIISNLTNTFKGCKNLQCINTLNTTGIATNQLDSFHNCYVLESPRFSEQDTIMNAPGTNWTNTIGCPVNTEDRDFFLKLKITSKEDPIGIMCDDDFTVAVGEVRKMYRAGTTAVVISDEDDGYVRIFSYGNVTNFRITDNRVVSEADLYICKSLTSLSYSFHNNTELTRILISDTSNVTDYSYAFYRCSNLKLSISDFYYGEALTLEHAFSFCSLVDSISSLSMKKVTNLDYAFNDCVLLDVSNIEVDAVTTAKYAFSNTAITDLTANFNLLLDARGLFMGSKLVRCNNGIDIATNIDYLFADCLLLESISSTSSFSDVLSAKYAFSNCCKLTNGFDAYLSMPVCTNFSHMLAGCVELTVANDYNTDAGQYFDYMYADNRRLSCINGINTTNKILTNDMFSGCYALVNPTRSEQHAITAGTNWTSASPCGEENLFDCIIDCDTNTSQKVLISLSHASLLATAVEGADIIYREFAAGSHSITALAGVSRILIHSKQTFTKITINGNAVVGIDIPRGETLTSLSYLASECYNVRSITAVTGSSLVSMDYAFTSTHQLYTLSVSNTSNVTTFSNCLRASGIKYFKGFDTGSGLIMNRMFHDCTNLICIGKVNTLIATNTINMFENTTSLVYPTSSEQAAIETGDEYILSKECG